ncbi:MAG: YiiX/YebB-like N1pC/P60 family cysteine hydrolase [Candidatus Eremiobacteraeota bacterium]|nr:YiiX/YebB-like N1pC/P60 family cysteine hydrolase [Candidatus Eremiobacteraeota bacterium]
MKSISFRGNGGALQGAEEMKRTAPSAGNEAAPGFPAQDMVVAGASGEISPALPACLSLPGKTWGFPLPRMSVLAGAVMLQVISAFSGALSASSLPDTEKKGFSASRLEEVRKSLMPGDIILSRTPSNQLYYLLQKAAFGSDYSHAAMVAGDGRIIDAYSKVKAQSLEDFCASQTALVILRPPYHSEEERIKALDYLERQVGKPYDWRFDLKDDSAHYCTEIVVKALEASCSRAEVKGRWALGRPVVVPDDLLNSPSLSKAGEFRS